MCNIAPTWNGPSLKSVAGSSNLLSEPSLQITIYVSDILKLLSFQGALQA